MDETPTVEDLSQDERRVFIGVTELDNRGQVYAAPPEDLPECHRPDGVRLAQDRLGRRSDGVWPYRRGPQGGRPVAEDRGRPEQLSDN